MENKQHKILVQFVRKEATPMGGIDIMESISIGKEIEKIAKKYGYECYLKGEKKEVLDYQPTNETYNLKTLEDIAELTAAQFEMFIEDLRNWCNVQKSIEMMKKIGLGVSSEPGMIRLDTGLHEEKLEVTMNVTNKIN